MGIPQECVVHETTLINRKYINSRCPNLSPACRCVAECSRTVATIAKRRRRQKNRLFVKMEDRCQNQRSLPPKQSGDLFSASRRSGRQKKNKSLPLAGLSRAQNPSNGFPRPLPLTLSSSATILPRPFSRSILPQYSSFHAATPPLEKLSRLRLRLRLLLFRRLISLVLFRALIR